MRRMTDNEWKQFVMERPAIAAVVRPDGRPHATPVGIEIDGDQIVFMTWHDSAKGKALSRLASFGVAALLRECT